MVLEQQPQLNEGELHNVKYTGVLTGSNIDDINTGWWRNILTEQLESYRV